MPDSSQNVDTELEDLLDDEQEFEEGEEEQEEIEVQPKKNKGGRPRKDQARTKLSDIEDPFVFAEAYMQENPTDSIMMKIRRGGALLREIDYSRERATVRNFNLGFVQKTFGGGLYSFEIFSLKTRRLVRDVITENLLDHTDFPTVEAFNAPTLDEKKEEANKADPLSSILAFLQTNQNQGGGNIADSLLKYAPLLPIVKEVISAFKPKEDPLMKEMMLEMIKGKQAQQSPEEMMLKVKMLMKEQEEESRKRQKEIDDEVDRRLEREKELQGLKPEKSFIEQGFEALSNITKTVEANAKIQTMKRQPVRPVKKLTQQPQVVQKPVPPTMPNPQPVTIEVKKDLKDEALEEAVRLVMIQYSDCGGDETKVSEFVMNTPSVLEVLKTNDIDTICNKVKVLLSLEEIPEPIREGIVKLYADCKI